MNTPWVPPTDSRPPARDRQRAVTLIMAGLLVLSFAAAALFMVLRRGATEDRFRNQAEGIEAPQSMVRPPHLPHA